MIEPFDGRVYHFDNPHKITRENLIKKCGFKWYDGERKKMVYLPIKGRTGKDGEFVYREDINVFVFQIRDDNWECSIQFRLTLKDIEDVKNFISHFETELLPADR